MRQGFFTQQGYVGMVSEGAMLFASEDDYLEFLEEKENSNCLISGMPKEMHFSISTEPVSLF